MKLMFETDKWPTCPESDWQTCNNAANCYSYILNRPDYFWAMPGMGYVKAPTQKFLDSGTQVLESFSSWEEFRQQMIDGAVRDGLILLDEPKDQDGYYLAALFLSTRGNERDFHWYRKDDDGAWSHKDGWRAPSNKDKDGNAILDPRDVPNPAYPIFGGFFLVPRKGVVLKQEFPLNR